MVRIHSFEKIDRKKIKELFQKRGGSVLTPIFVNDVLEILNSKRRGREVHQCECGELMIFSTAHAEMLRKKYKTDDIPCEMCGKRL